jgi:hypothetical protein
MVQQTEGGGMFRFAVIVAAAMILAGCSELARQAQEAKRKEIEAAKIPEVKLTPAQVAALTVTRERMRVVWVGAGLQKEDGKTFACAVLAPINPPALGNKDSVAVITGTFEPDGSFSNKYNIIIGEQDPIGNCQRKGFDPPVRTVRTYSTMTIR